MKLVTMDKVLHALETMDQEVIMPEDMMEKARIPLQKMLELAK